MPRTLNVLTARGSVWLTVRDSRTASRIAEYRNAVKIYRRTGDVAALQTFQGQSFRANGVVYPFITKTETLRHLGHAGLLALESLYRAVGAGSR